MAVKINKKRMRTKERKSEREKESEGERDRQKLCILILTLISNRKLTMKLSCVIILIRQEQKILKQ